MGTRMEALKALRRVRAWALPAICGALIAGHGWAQGTAGKSSGGSPSQDGPGALGFSIESEMLTYRALESNSEAVACDIAAYLSGGATDFEDLPARTACKIDGGAPGKAAVIVVPFDNAQFNNFALWRADMQVMHELRTRAAGFSCSMNPNQPVAMAEKGAVAPPLLPATSALSLVQTALGLMSTETSASPVAGTIQDQAFIDGVARELRGLNFPVLTPTVYAPYELTPIDQSKSPYLTNLEKLYQVRRCLVIQAVTAATAKETSAQEDMVSITRLLNDIDSFLAEVGLSGAAEAKATAPPQAGDKPSGASTQAEPSAAQTGTTKPAQETASTAQQAAAPPSLSQSQSGPSSGAHLMAVLEADSFARKLGVDPETGLLADNGASMHILMVKALESGGTIEKKANILGTKMRYTGGSVGTFAMFSLDGELECSGNVYEYGGSLASKDFQKGLRDYIPDPSKQFLFQRGNCSAPVAH